MKVLIVDDSGSMRRILRKEFTSQDEIFEASNGQDALKLYDLHHPDLITMDVDMPGMDGFETCARIRGVSVGGENFNDNHTPIVFITANDTLKGRQHGFSVGASDFITKPFVRGELGKLATRQIAAIQEKPFAGLTVLVAEDNDATRHMLEKILINQGINCIAAANGWEAYEMLKSHGEQVDLLLTDYDMPIMSGVELCEKVRHELGMVELPVIFLTGMNERDYIVEIFKAGASDYISKPFIKEELLSRFKVHLLARQLSRSLEWKVGELKRMNKFKDQLMAVTSHDLRAPLQGIMAYSELLMDVDYIKDEHKDWIGSILKSGELLNCLVSDVLALGRIQLEDELPFESLCIDEILEETLETVGHMATAKGVQVIFETEGGPAVYLPANRNALNRVMNNLVTNAIKFTHEQGEVQVSLKNLGDQIQITVQDTGIGIPDALLANLFKEFSGAARVGTAGEASTGLGLSIVKGLVEKHGGSIDVKTEEGEGTCFTVTLPVAPAG